MRFTIKTTGVLTGGTVIDMRKINHMAQKNRKVKHSSIRVHKRGGHFYDCGHPDCEIQEWICSRCGKIWEKMLTPSQAVSHMRYCAKANR